nr:hypothetical protein [Gleimia europaea]
CLSGIIRPQAPANLLESVGKFAGIVVSAAPSHYDWAIKKLRVHNKANKTNSCLRIAPSGFLLRGSFDRHGDSSNIDEISVNRKVGLSLTRYGEGRSTDA